MKVLIVDDSRAVQTIIRRALEKSDIKPIEFNSALNGEEAVSLVSSWSPDLVITDWHMPTMSGIELLQVLRQSGFDRLKVGFVTTESSAKHLDQARANGAVFVVNKPFKDEDLQNAVREAMRNHVEAAITQPAAGSTPIDGQDLEGFLSGRLGVTCTLRVVERTPLEQLALPYVVGVFVSGGSKAVAGICLLDLRAALLVGGYLNGMSDAAMSRAIAQNMVDQEVFASVSAVLGESSAILFPPTNGQQISMSGNHLVQKPSPKLHEIMQRSVGRVDYRLSHSGLEAGLISILPN